MWEEAAKMAETRFDRYHDGPDAHHAGIAIAETCRAQAAKEDQL